ncbi:MULTISPECIES: peptidylprolyl isomerase [unclassified Enterococcus]|jgi:foldase protein PrsA|uniref:peptidylprolyl isomerase n=1 Tax=unclassified Enterococcus TaxID=2608891 RepID=UPI003D28BBE0
MKHKLKFGFAILVASAALAACSTNEGDKAIVTMKGGTITQQDLYDKLKTGSEATQQVQMMTVMEVFNNKYGDKVTDKEVDAEYDKTAEQLGDSFEEQLAAVNYTKESYKEDIKKQLAYNKGLESHIKLTDDDLKTAWESFHPEVEAQIIKLDSEDDAKDVKKSADDKGDFTKLAKEKSTDTTTKEDGGKIKFDSQSTTVPSEVKEAAFKLKDGQISDVITATDTSTYATSYYVVKMVKNQDKGNDMDKYKDEVKEIAKQTKLNDSTFTSKVVAEELKEANVKVKDTTFQDALNSLTGTTSSSTESSK